MEGYAVFAGTIEIVESVDGRFVVLFAWLRTVRCQKGKDRCNIRTAACGHPVDGAVDALVNFGAALEIRIVCSSWRKRIDWEARLVGCHVGDAVHLIDAKTIGGELSERSLTQVDGDVTIVVT